MCISSRSAFREAKVYTRPNPLALLASIFDRGRLGLIKIELGGCQKIDNMKNGVKVNQRHV